MEKTHAEPTTTARNLEAQFDRGQEVLDYFDKQKAKVIRPRNRAGKSCVVELPAKKPVVVSEHAGSYGRKGSVKGRTQSENPVTKDWTNGNETPGRKHKGEFMDVKSDGKKFKGVAKEPDKRRK